MPSFAASLEHERACRSAGFVCASVTAGCCGQAPPARVVRTARYGGTRGSHQSCGAAARLRRLALSGREGMGRLKPAAPCQSRGGGNAVLLRLCCRRLLVLAPVTRRPLDAEGDSLGAAAPPSGGSLAPGRGSSSVVTGICRPRLYQAPGQKLSDRDAPIG